MGIVRKRLTVNEEQTGIGEKIINVILAKNGVSSSV
jgi:hypothetical protein